jgi:hypothetical protein
MERFHEISFSGRFGGVMGLTIEKSSPVVLS